MFYLENKYLDNNLSLKLRIIKQPRIKSYIKGKTFSAPAPDGKCSDCPKTESCSWHRKKAYDRNSPLLCNSCYQRIFRQSGHIKPTRNSQAYNRAYYRNHKWRYFDYSTPDGYLRHLYNSYLKRTFSKDLKIPEDRFVQTMKKDRTFIDMYLEWSDSQFNPLMQPQIRRISFKGSLAIGDLTWRRKKDVDEERVRKKELFAQYVQYLIKLRKDHSETEIFDSIKTNGSKFSGRKFNRTLVVKEFQAQIKKQLELGQLLDYQGYLYPSN